jgi:hypothetical protein
LRVLPSRRISGIGQVGRLARTFSAIRRALAEVGCLVCRADLLGALTGDVDLVVAFVGDERAFQPV